MLPVNTFADVVTDGSLLLAAPVAFIVGLISFLSPCTLPLVPGYLSYVTGMAGADLGSEVEGARGRGRVVLGAALFVLGFTAVFVSFGALFGHFGARLDANATVIGRVLGSITILLGIAFLGYLPMLQREWRIHRLPRAGLLGAPVLGVVFGIGWAPCLGPTLGAIQTLAFNEGSAGKGAFLTLVYSLGLGLPFLVVAIAFRRSMGALEVVRRHYRAVTVFGGVMLIAVGLLLVTGLWNEFSIWMRIHINGRFGAVV